MRQVSKVLTVAAVGATAFLGSLGWMATTANTAEACGGCFAPSETVTIVTGHRMAVAISNTETTLWDQIEYAGEPEDFVWVLPIEGEQLVELADNAFFQALDQATQINLRGSFAPVRTQCPDPCNQFLSSRAGNADGAPDPSAPPVEVFGRAVVGPYETATIGSEDPMALIEWLQDNGYTVPDEILPTIAHYTDRDLNFAVLRLRPDAGVNQMQPVRVTTPGMMPVFPLRMVSAGVSGSVELDLFVLGEGRYEAANFDVREIDTQELIFDWSENAFNYLEVFDSTIRDNGGRVWIAEYARGWRDYQYVQDFVARDEDGNEVGSARDDFDVVLRNIENPYLTRLRTDMKADYLVEDLILQASLRGGDISNVIRVDNEINRPADVVCPTTCNEAPGTNPGSRFGELGFGSGRGDGCSVGRTGAGFSALALGLFAVGLIARKRRRS